MLELHTTTVNSVILYQCQQSGFAPSSNSSVCEEDGRWSPDPSQVMCVMVPGTLMEITKYIPIPVLFSTVLSYSPNCTTYDITLNVQFPEFC